MPAASRSIAVDAMGGDNAPGEIVRGCVRAVQELGVEVTLVGRAASLMPLLGGGVEGIDIVDATEVVEMHEHPANAVRAKRDSSIVRACTLVAEGNAGAAVSAGNSGAMLAAALFTVKRAPGVARPAIGAAFPSASGRTFILDVGANTDCRPEWLAQFALMGDIYARTMMGIAEPRIALLSNGEEAEKGSELVQAARPLIEALPPRFTGNIEGKDIFTGGADVVVTDGFTGNVALKTAEGVGEFLFAAIAREARASVIGKVGGALLKPRLRPLRDTIDYRKTGGALLLGVAGEIVIAHGRSDAEAIVNAVRVAKEAIDHDVSGAIAKAIVGAVRGEAGDAAGGSGSRADEAPGGASQIADASALPPRVEEDGGEPAAAGPASASIPHTAEARD